MSANSDLAAAILDGDDKVSFHDILVSLAYLYSSGATAQTLLASAISNGNDKLEDRDIMICIASVFNP